MRNWEWPSRNVCAFLMGIVNKANAETINYLSRSNINLCKRPNYQQMCECHSDFFSSPSHLCVVAHDPTMLCSPASSLPGPRFVSSAFRLCPATRLCCRVPTDLHLPSYRMRCWAHRSWSFNLFSFTFFFCLMLAAKKGLFHNYLDYINKLKQNFNEFYLTGPLLSSCASSTATHPRHHRLSPSAHALSGVFSLGPFRIAQLQCTSNGNSERTKWSWQSTWILYRN